MNWNESPGWRVLAYGVVSAYAVMLWTGHLYAADDEGVEFFEKKIRPVLVQHCYECHAADSKELGGNLLLDSRAGVLTGGDSGAALKAGDVQESLLLKAVRYEDDSVHMPPRGKLSAEIIADLEDWVRRGAPDPRDQPTQRRAVASWEETLKQRAAWWSLQPVRAPEVPTPANVAWSDQPIDQFLLSRLESAGLSPAEPAPARTLARRLSLVLTGLPPTPEQVQAFVRDCEDAQGETGGPLPQAIVANYVDALLASPQFGERWARHWMDVVRFTETHGNEWNYDVHHAWRYRDYLIRAFNADVPFDQFIREHIAGDLLPEPRWNETEHIAESPIGTGFYRFGEVNHDDCISLPEIGYDLADNQIDTLTKAFQATTVACARCHDHKLDAVSMRDYYALLGIVRSSRMTSLTVDAPQANADLKQRLTELKVAIRRELADLWRGDLEPMERYLLAVAERTSDAADASHAVDGFDADQLAKWIAAFDAEKPAVDDLWEPWRQLVRGTVREWASVKERYIREDRERREFNQANYETYADFRTAPPADWQVGGLGLREPASHGGEFVIDAQGESLVQAILPAGYYTHTLSAKLNGTLRSPVLPTGRANISFQVLGQHSSAVRLVSNNCQLNYKNYRALTNPELHWVTFSPPPNRDSLRTYAELMTLFDNPKFPDQLGTLGGDTVNLRVPYEEAAADPRSYFGVTQVVLHDVGEPPRGAVDHLLPLFAGAVPQSLGEVAARYRSVIAAALKNWSADEATDADVRWLQGLLSRGLLSNRRGLSTRLDQLIDEYRQSESKLSLPTVIAGVSDSGMAYDQPVFLRGNCTQPGESVPRRYLEVLADQLVEVSDTASPGKPRIPAYPADRSGRLELARQIASGDNPLTARVMVNRVWHHLFGTGLVRTVDDFGQGGEPPSHPELLDHLASRFVADGWSVKRLIRSIVLTQTFQLSNRPSIAADERDPTNRLLQHFPARRLEAEAIRDAMLAASGRLDPRQFGPSVHPYRENAYPDRRLFPGPLDGDGRRSIYIRNTLMEPPKFLAAFNFPGGKVTQGRRDVTNVQAQALALLNDPFVLQQADIWAERLVQRSDATMNDRVAHMFATALNRPPSSQEREEFSATIMQLAELHAVPMADVLTNRAIWKDVAHIVFNLKEFLYVP